MRQRCFAFFCFWTILLALAGGQAHAYITSDRWTQTATNPTTGSQGTPITLTWSFAPDGTSIPGNPTGTLPSNLLNFLDTNWGVGPGGSDLTQRPWFPIFSQSFDRIGALSGVTYIYEPNDDGRNFSNTNPARGILGERGDIRLGGKTYGSGSNVLASNFYPDYGEMMINTDKVSFFTNSTNNFRRFRNTIMHEAMHGIGIDHVESSNAAFLIEPFLGTSFDGPQLDDLLAIQRLHGDVYEKSGGNDTFGIATSLGPLSPTQSIAIGTLGGTTTIGGSQVDFLSVDDESDTDFFSFALTNRLDVQLLLTPRGASYLVAPETDPPTTQTTLNTLTLSNLSLALMDTNGTSLLNLADSNAAGLSEEVLRQLLPGTYYARVKGAQNDIQIYGLNLTATVPLPANLLWVGNLSPDWTVGVVNFSNGSGPAPFYDFDNVTFDDTSSVKAVNLPGNISAGNIRVTTADSYLFSGAGGIIAGNLTVDGSGVVELANSGNSYAGPTQVLAGTLKITGDANAMVTPITVASGATLLMDAADAAAMASTFTVQVGGTLQIGTLESDANVFPDLPAAIVNDGTIRVADEETLRSISGTGQIVAERETTYLLANAAFDGEVVVEAGAVVRVQDGAGLGSATGATVIEDLGSLVVDTSETLSDPISLAGDGGDNGAIQIALGHTATLTGSVTLTSNMAAIHVMENSTGTFSGALDGAANDAHLTLEVGEGGNLALQGAVELAGGGITKRGPGAGELAGELSYTGPTGVEEGGLRLSGSGTLGGEFQVAQGATLELAGAHVFEATSRLDGNGQIVGDVAMPGTIAPGNSAGTLSFADDLTLLDTSRIEIQLGGTTGGVNYDILSIAGVANLDGILDVSFIDDFMAALDDSFEVLRADGGIFGQFDLPVLPSLMPEFAWDVVYSNFSVLLQVVDASMVSLPGDFNQDGNVDAADYIVWRHGLGTTHTSDDYDIWRTHFGETAGGGAAAIGVLNAAVPEATGFVLAMTGIIIGLASARRR